MNPCIL